TSRILQGGLLMSALPISRLETLESRRLLSANVVLNTDGTLVVTGNAGVANNIAISLDNSGTQVDVKIGGVLQSPSPNKIDVSKIKVFGSSAGDTITIDETNGAL